MAAVGGEIPLRQLDCFWKSGHQLRQNVIVKGEFRHNQEANLVTGFDGECAWEG
ncbi:hypothetical protein [Agrobacterium sp.]|uniref:hypothetical protein n=1 Tax=Agrobacterium sp. TaxID=361 RepID=UPI0028AEB914|nr:hypothetical protein [Agrobacterium sp.]